MDKHISFEPGHAPPTFPYAGRLFRGGLIVVDKQHAQTAYHVVIDAQGVITQRHSIETPVRYPFGPSSAWRIGERILRGDTINTIALCIHIPQNTTWLVFEALAPLLKNLMVRYHIPWERMRLGWKPPSGVVPTHPLLEAMIMGNRMTVHQLWGPYAPQGRTPLDAAWHQGLESGTYYGMARAPIIYHAGNTSGVLVCDYATLTWVHGTVSVAWIPPHGP